MKGARPGPAKPGPAVRSSQVKKQARRLAEHNARMERIKRSRTFAMFGGLVPLVGLTACDAGLAIACLPREIYLGIWAAIVGAFAGLSIRLVLERRRFQQQSPPG